MSMSRPLRPDYDYWRFSQRYRQEITNIDLTLRMQTRNRGMRRLGGPVIQIIEAMAVDN